MVVYKCDPPGEQLYTPPRYIHYLDPGNFRDPGGAPAAAGEPPGSRPGPPPGAEPPGKYRSQGKGARPPYLPAHTCHAPTQTRDPRPRARHDPAAKPAQPPRDRHNARSPESISVMSKCRAEQTSDRTRFARGRYRRHANDRPEKPLLEKKFSGGEQWFCIYFSPANRLVPPRRIASASSL